MNRTFDRWRYVFALALSSACGQPAAVRADPILVPTYIPARPAYDARDLATLAPPSTAATARETYGDAAFGRRQPIITRRAFADTRPNYRGYVCLDGPSGAPQDACPPATQARPGTTYVFTPSYVSAPQVFKAAPGAPSPILSPITRFFLNPFD